MCSLRPCRPHLVILDGPSAAGKTLMLAHLRVQFSASMHVVSKLTTRSRRPTDRGWEFQYVDSVPHALSHFSYRSVGNVYAVDLADLSAGLRSAKVCAVSCVDAQVISRLGSAFRTIVIYIHRHLDDTEFNALIVQKAASQDEKQSRFQERASAPAAYAAKLDLYNHVLLNIGSKDDLKRQMAAVLRFYGIEPNSNPGSS